MNSLTITDPSSSLPSGLTVFQNTEGSSQQPTPITSSSRQIRPTLVFTKTPVPPLSSTRSNGRKNLKKRPPTPGGPAVGRYTHNAAGTPRQPPTPTPNPSRLTKARSSSETQSSSQRVEHVHRATSSQASSSPSPQISPGLGKSPPHSAESSTPSFADQRRAASKIMSAREREEERALENALMSSAVFGLSSFPMLAVTRMPRLGSIPSPADTSPRRLAIYDGPADNSNLIPAYHLTFPELPVDDPPPIAQQATLPIQAPSKSEPTPLNIPNHRPQSSASTMPDSPNTKALMERLLSAPDYHGVGDGSDEKDGGGIDVASDSDSSIKFASVAKKEPEEIGAVENRVWQQRENTKIKRLLGTMSDDEFVRPRYTAGPGAWSGEESGGEDGIWAKSLDNGPSGFEGKNREHDGGDRIRRTRSGLPSPLSPRWNGDEGYSSREDVGGYLGANLRDRQPPRHPEKLVRGTHPYNHPDNSPPVEPTPPKSPRVHALDSLSPNHGGIKRSQSTSAVSSTPSIRSGRSRRSPTAPTFPNISSRLSSLPAVAASLPPSPASPNWPTDVTAPTPVEAPLISPRTSSKTPITARQVSGESKTKEKRRRSALLWVKEHTGLVNMRSISDSASTSPNAFPKMIRHGISTSEGKPTQPKLGMDPRRNGSLPNALGSSSSEYVPMAPLPQTVYSPFAPNFERFGIPVNRSDPGHGLRENVGSGRHKGSMDTSYHSHGHGTAESSALPDVSPYYTILGLPAGSVAGRWDSQKPKPDHRDTRSIQRSVTVSAEHSKVHKSEKGIFGFGFKRSASSKKADATPTSSWKEEKKPRNRLRGRSVTEGSSKLRHADSCPSGRKSREDLGGLKSTDKPTKTHRSYSVSMDAHLFDESGLSMDRKDSFGGSTHSTGDRSFHRRDGSNSRKLWKFVKRISSNNGLRDKYNDIPPVPSLPLEYPSTPTSPVTPEMSGHDILARVPSTSRRGSADHIDFTSPSKASKGNTPSKPSSSSRLKYATSSPGETHEHPYSRPVPQTRSSTPGSSDNIQSSKAPRRTFSAHSSASSLGDQRPAPPLPPPPSSLSHMMSSPVDRGHLSDSGYNKSFSPTRTSMSQRRQKAGKSKQTAIEDDWTTLDFPSLPTPPRRPKPVVSSPKSQPVDIDDGVFKLDPADLEEFDDSESTMIPEFSIDNVINTFSSRKAPMNTEGSLPTEALPLPHTIPVPSTALSNPPPPRPARNIRRPSAPAIASRNETSDNDNSVQNSPLSSTSPQAPSGLVVLPDCDSHGPRPITSSFGPPTSPVKQPLSPSDAGSPSTELAKVLTDKQKADKWDALLEKSAMAGGTLHLKFD